MDVSRSLLCSESPNPAFHPSLGWAHYRLLMRLPNPEARSFYEIEAARESWSVRQLERQVEAILFQRRPENLQASRRPQRPFRPRVPGAERAALPVQARAGSRAGDHRSPRRLPARARQGLLFRRPAEARHPLPRTRVSPTLKEQPLFMGAVWLDPFSPSSRAGLSARHSVHPVRMASRC